jgi:hypothetical protein
LHLMQAQDYAASLKSDDGVLVRDHMMRVLWLFIKVGGRQCSEYIRGMLCNFNVLHHLFTVKHPVWRMFETNPSAFNEEAGELSLSVLARLTSSTPSQSSLSQLNNKYRLIRLQLQCAQDLNVELSRHSASNSHHHQRISPLCDDVVATGVYFSKIIRQMVTNCFKPAGDEVPEFKDNHVVPPQLVPVLGSTVQWLSHSPSAASQMRALSSKASSKTEANWMQNLMHAWDDDADQPLPRDVNDVDLPGTDSDTPSEPNLSDYGMVSDWGSPADDNTEEDGRDVIVLDSIINRQKSSTSSHAKDPPSDRGVRQTGQSKPLREGSSVDKPCVFPRSHGSRKPARKKSKDQHVVSGDQGKNASTIRPKTKKRKVMTPYSFSADDEEFDAADRVVQRQDARIDRKRRAQGSVSKKKAPQTSYDPPTFLRDSPPTVTNPRRGQTRKSRQTVPYDDGGGHPQFEDFYGTADELAQDLHASDSM